MNRWAIVRTGRAYLLLVVGCMLLAISPGTANRIAAEENRPGATPGTTGTPALDVPGLAECSFAPRPDAEFARFLHQAYAQVGEATPSPTPDWLTIDRSSRRLSLAIAGTPWVVNGDVLASPPAPYAGRPVDPATRAAVVASVRGLTACANAGDFRRFLTLYSDARLVEVMAGSRVAGEDSAALTEADWDAALHAPNRPKPADLQAVAPVVLDVRLLPDGRVAALFVPGLGVEAFRGRDPSTVRGYAPMIYLLTMERGLWAFEDDFVGLNELPVIVASPVADRGAQAVPMAAATS